MNGQHNNPETERRIGDQSTNERIRWVPIFPNRQQDSPPQHQPVGESTRSRIPNWVAFGLFALAAFLAVWHYRPIAQALEKMTRIGQTGDPVEDIKGLSIFGIVLVAILAALRIALNANRNDRR